MNSSEYKAMQSRSLTLPVSGATVRVRKLKQLDFLEVGDVPAALSEDIQKRSASLKVSKEALLFGAKIIRIALLKCCSELKFSDGTLKIVDKPESEPGEITIEELDDLDANSIVDAVKSLSGMTKEAAEKARPFPKKQKVAGEPGPSSQAVPETSN
jgi:hypothetical protein